MSLPLLGKVALVIGSSRGIGAATARHLAKDGASIIVNYNSSEAAARVVVDEINTNGVGKAVAIKANMSSLADASRLVEETVQAFGKLDILVCNAGVNIPSPLVNVEETQFDRQFRVNVKTPLFMVKTASNCLKDGRYYLDTCFGCSYLPEYMIGGRVIFITSTTTKISGITPQFLLFAASKGATE